jgi:hypothetical protein
MSPRPDLRCWLFLCLALLAGPVRAFDAQEAVRRGTAALLERHGDDDRQRIERGVEQTARMWRDEDGSVDDFVDFVTQYFITDDEELQDTFGRYEYALEMVDGHFVSMQRELRHWLDEDVGPIRRVDHLLGAWDPSAHLAQDFFETKVAFAALLNFPVTSLQQRLDEGPGWTRQQWAIARLTGRFDTRIPADVQQRLSLATTRADAYIADYNLYLHHWLTESGERLFPEKLRLITHWGLRDELKSHYASADERALERQRMIASVMDHIVRQTIPQAVVNNPLVDWKPSSNSVSVSPVRDVEPPEHAIASDDASREPDTRYSMLLDIFHAMRAIDPYTPETPNAIQRTFEAEREIPVQRVKDLFRGMFRTAEARRTADFIARRLGRDLEPFDIWYAGFKSRAAFEEAELDAITRKRYPTSQAFEADIPRILTDLGFAPDTAAMLASHIVVDPSRGAGHAWGAERRDDQAHLRTRVGPEGMDYKGYNIAVHELGHNVEQVFSLNTIDHTLLSGVPANAFTEALAFVFQERDLELLGLTRPDESTRHMQALESFWGTLEIGAVSLVDIAVWEWMYEHPEATSAELRQATVHIAETTWNETFGTLMKAQDSSLLGVYSHMLAYPLYLANYPLGHLIAFQLEEHFASHDLASEFERVCQLGRLTPDLWMQRAVGSPLSSAPLEHAVDRALDALSQTTTRGMGGDE